MREQIKGCMSQELITFNRIYKELDDVYRIWQINWVCLRAHLTSYMESVRWVMDVCRGTSAGLPACRSRQSIPLFIRWKSRAICYGCREKEEVCISI